MGNWQVNGIWVEEPPDFPYFEMTEPDKASVAYPEPKQSTIPRLELAPAKKDTIASFKVKIRWGKRSSYVHKVKVFERDGQTRFHCSRFCGQPDSFAGSEPCAGMQNGERAVGSIAKSPETAISDLREWINAGGNMQALVDDLCGTTTNRRTPAHTARSRGSKRNELGQ